MGQNARPGHLGQRSSFAHSFLMPLEKARLPMPRGFQWDSERLGPAYVQIHNAGPPGRHRPASVGHPRRQSLTGFRPGARCFICSFLRRNTAEHFGQWMGSFLSNSAFAIRRCWQA